MKQIDIDTRPNPDQLLLTLQKKNPPLSQGRLKIFLGMAPGVGKTYAMLRAAQELQSRGVDVVVGIVETHQRKETEAQISKLEVLPRRSVLYKGKPLEEFDLDGALARAPALLLVDELAHTNVPDSRNNKRYLDILELLHAGIDVYTAVNVQHMESRSHTVKEITDVTVRETVPDSFFDAADEIIVIDLPPEDLLKRLQEGLVYKSERAQAAQANFFQEGTLTALREMALRAAAERVDKDLREYRVAHNVQEIWKSSHRLLVAIFASPYAETLIRSTRRLADSLNASWIGAYVDDNKPLSAEEKQLLATNMTLVQELGGEIITRKDEDPVRGLIRIARQNNVTQIVLGKSARPWWYTLFSGGSLVSRLIRASNDIDIYSISSPISAGKKKKSVQLEKINAFESISNEWGLLAGISIASWLLATIVNHVLGPLSVGFVFLLAVCLSGLFLTRTSIFLLATILACIHDFFFIPPIYTFRISHSEDICMLVMFFISAALMGHLTSRLRMREKNLLAREDSLLASYSLAKSLLSARGVREVVHVGMIYMEQIFPFQVLVLCQYGDRNEHAGSWGFTYLDTKEKAVIHWVLTNGKHAGRFTQTLSASHGYYIPLIGKDSILGVIGINAKDLPNLEGEQVTALENLSNQIASALEREIFHAQAKTHP